MVLFYPKMYFNWNVSVVHTLVLFLGIPRKLFLTILVQGQHWVPRQLLDCHCVVCLWNWATLQITGGSEELFSYCVDIQKASYPLVFR